MPQLAMLKPSKDNFQHILPKDGVYKAVFPYYICVIFAYLSLK